MDTEIDMREKLKGTPKQAGARIYKAKPNFENSSNKNNTVSSDSNFGSNSNSKRTSISSFHSQKATKHSQEHMKRESKVTYLLIQECKDNEYKSYEDIEKYKKDAVKIYKEKIGQKMQSKAKENLIKEAVLNIKKNTTIADIEKTFKNLNNKFGGHFILDLAIHKDEGVFLDTNYDIEDLEYSSKTLTWRNTKLDIDVTNEVIDYAPNRNIFYDDKSKHWYLDKQHEQKADISTLKPWMNYHAHVIYSNFDKEIGKTARLDRGNMRELQTIVAQSLGMSRGEEFSKTKRMNHWQLKASIDAKRDIKMKSLVKHKDLDLEIKKLREELKERKAPREEYSKLEQLNRDLKDKIRNKDLSVGELKEILSAKEETITYQNKILDEKKEVITDYIDQDKKRRLYTNGKIITERVKIKDSLFKSKEVLIYKKESVDAFIEKAKGTEGALKTVIEDLESKNLVLTENNGKLQELKTFMISHFKTLNMDKAIEIIKENIPKVEKKNKQQSRDLER